MSSAKVDPKPIKALYVPQLSRAELKVQQDEMYETLFETIHVSKKGNHFPMVAFYGGGSGRIEVPVQFMSTLGLKKKTRIALTLVKDAASLEAARRKGVMEETPMIVVTVIKDEEV